MSSTDRTTQNRTSASASASRPRRQQLMPVDVLERANGLQIVADLPGVSRDDIEIHVENGILTLHGRARDRAKGGVRYVWKEIQAVDYLRSFQLSDAINVEGIVAMFDDGVLLVHLPLVPTAQPRSVKVDRLV